MSESENITYIKSIQERLQNVESKLVNTDEQIDEIVISETIKDLDLLKNVEINKNILKITKIGITVNKFTKINNEDIQNVSKYLIEKWKNIALNEKMSIIKNIQSIKKRKSGNFGDSNADSDDCDLKKVKVLSDSINTSLISLEDSSKKKETKDHNNDMNNDRDKINNDKNNDRKNYDEKNIDEEHNSSNSNDREHKINDLKLLEKWNYDGKLHNDVHRDKAKQFLFKAFITGASDKLLYIVEKNKLNDIICDIENELYKFYIQKRNSQREYNMQLKSIKFNLSDKKNPNFNEKIYKEFISSNVLVTMNSQDMASDEKKNEREKCLQESLIACQSDWDIKNILLKKSRKGEFQCYKCKGYDTIYHQLQTRSSDEPMTTFVTCLKCNNRWKF